ncbi:MAG: hypothetical protein FJ090_22305, partial [Deltaproteobacteria bacterium]|nr:hypothetical protein [Deltaproteobacteria bacterium]
RVYLPASGPCCLSSAPGYSGSPGNGLCADWTMGCGVCLGNHWYMTHGKSDQTGTSWTDNGWVFCGGSYPLYCFET